MIQPATFERTLSRLAENEMYLLTDRKPGDHSGVYVEIEHVDDLVNLVEATARELITMEEDCGNGTALGKMGRTLLATVEKYKRK